MVAAGLATAVSTTREFSPGPLVSTSEELLDALADLEDRSEERRERYSRFQQTFCSLEDGHATDRVLDLLFPPGGTAGRTAEERG